MNLVTDHLGHSAALKLGSALYSHYLNYFIIHGWGVQPDKILSLIVRNPDQVTYPALREREGGVKSHQGRSHSQKEREYQMKHKPHRKPVIQDQVLSK